MKKQTLIFYILFLLMATSADAVEFDGIYYVLNSSDKTAEVIYDGNSLYSGDVNIPAEVFYNNENYSVISIRELAFYNCSGLTSVTIPNSVTRIGWSAFAYCSNLISVKGGDGVYTIGEEAFLDCSSLKDISFGKNIRTIKEDAFKGCNALEKVIVKDIAAWCGIDVNENNNPLSMAGHLFSDENSEIFDLIIPDDVTSINDNTFSHCFKLRSIIFPKGLKSIGKRAFYWCSSLSSSIVLSGCTDIGQDAFYECKGITSVDINGGEIGGNAFFECNNIKTVNIGDDVTYISGGAFGSINSAEIQSLTFGSCILTISAEAFGKVRKVIIKDLSAWCNNTFESNPLRLSQHIFSDENTEIKDLVIPEGVTSIPDHAFADCIGLNSVSFPSSLYNIHACAFSGCKNLSSVTFPNYLYKIEAYAFCGTNLKAINIPRVIEVEDAAFLDCSSLETVEISSGLTTLGSDSYYTFDTGVFEGCKMLKSVSLPNSMEFIGNGAFRECSSLYDIVIPDGVVKIGLRAFDSCSCLKSITLPGSVKEIGNYAFYNCNSLEEVYSVINEPFEINRQIFCNFDKNTLNSLFTSAVLYVPIGTKERYDVIAGWKEFIQIVEMKMIGTSLIDNGIIYKVVNLNPQEVHVVSFYEDLPNNCVIPPTKTDKDGSIYSVTGIDSYAFVDCSKLSSISIPNSVKTIDNMAFWRCRNLMDVIIPNNSLTTISESSFAGCYSLSSITIPYGVTSIENDAFYGCIGLKSVTIPCSVNFISYAFLDCGSLTSILSLNREPPFLETNSFQENINNNCTIWVPKGSAGSYKNADNWKNFKNIRELIAGDLNLDGKINDKDLNGLIDFIMGKKLEGFYMCLADLNGDDKVNAVDVVILINNMDSLMPEF